MRAVEHQEYQALREGAEVLEADRHGEKVLRLADGTFLKLFRRKRLITSAAWSPYARRFAENASALARLGIPVPEVIEIMRIASLKRDAVHYRPLAGTTLRALNHQPGDEAARRDLQARFGEFVVQLHRKGIYFRSLHLGNVILTPNGEFGLIDFSDMRVYPWPLPKFMRVRNIRRLQGIESERDWIDSDFILRR